MYKIYSLLYLIIGLSLYSHGQVTILQVLNIENVVPVPFAILEFDTTYYQTDIDGFVSLDFSVSKEVNLSHPFYYSLDTLIHHQGDSVIIYLEPKVLGGVNHTNLSTTRIMSYVLSHVKDNNIYNKAPFKYTSYNKARVSTNNIEATKGLLNKVLKMFSIEIKTFDKFHHILLAESVTNREYLNQFNNKEYILSSKISGIENPKMLALNSQLQSMSIYDKFIKVIDKSYISPLFEGAHKRYNYKLLTTIHQGEDELYVIQFNANGKLKQVLLAGVLYVSSQNWAIESAIIRPDKSSATNFDVFFKYAKQEDVWIPHSYSTRIEVDNISANKFQFVTRYSTYIYDFEFDVEIKKDVWDDVSIEFLDEGLQDSIYSVEKNRKEFFSKKDEDTYVFYDTVGSLNNIDVVFDFAEHLYEKEIQTRYFNIDLNRAFDFNNYEGARIGSGANKDLGKKEKLNIGGHIAYGLKDNDSKYGVKMRYKFFPLKKLTVFGGADNETYESAHGVYSFYRYQYTTEWLRRFAIDVMDVAQRYYIGVETSPIKYTSLSLKLMSSKNFTPYNYQYKDNSTDIYQYTDVELGMRFAFGETNFKLYNNKYRLKTYFPVLWTRFNFGLDNFLGGEYDYVKFESRIEYTMRSFLLGTGHIQFNFGHAIGDLPYYQLFEGYGGDGAAVAHNRFETMGINEFLSSTYMNLFLTYEIAKLYFRDYPKFRPSIELDYNFGIGGLKNIDDHHDFSFKTMEKTYHEAGIAVRNLVTFKLVVAKIGLGVGNYIRFGHYAYPTLKENYNAKAFLTFAL